MDGRKGLKQTFLVALIKFLGMGEFSLVFFVCFCLCVCVCVTNCKAFNEAYLSFCLGKYG